MQVAEEEGKGKGYCWMQVADEDTGLGMGKSKGSCWHSWWGAAAMEGCA